MDDEERDRDSQKHPPTEEGSTHGAPFALPPATHCSVGQQGEKHEEHERKEEDLIVEVLDEGGGFPGIGR